MKTSRFGEPAPASVTTLGVALEVNVDASDPVLNDGLFAKARAAAPATCGEAMLVPLIVTAAVGEVFHADVMEEPGAKRSRHVP